MVHKLPELKDKRAQATFGDWADRPVKNWKQTTTIVGDFFEAATGVLLGAQRYRVTSGCVCPDLIKDGKIFLESKAMKNKSGHALLYLHRIEKYEELVKQEKKKLVYVVWIHNTNVKVCKFDCSVRKSLCKHIHSAYIIPMKIMHGFRSELAVKDYAESGYEKFIRLKHSDLRRLPHKKIEVTGGFSVYGREVNMFPLVTVA